MSSFQNYIFFKIIYYFKHLDNINCIKCFLNRMVSMFWQYNGWILIDKTDVECMRKKHISMQSWLTPILTHGSFIHNIKKNMYICKSNFKEHFQHHKKLQNLKLMMILQKYFGTILAQSWMLRSGYIYR